MKNLFTLALLVLITSAKSQTKESAWFSLKDKSYTLRYPNNWELDQTGQGGTSFILLSVLEDAYDKFRENVNLIVQDVKGKNIDLAKFTEISTEQIKTMIPNSKIISSELEKRKSGEYRRIVYTCDQGKFHLQFEQRYWVINNKAYILTFTAEETKYANFIGTATKILESFTIKN